MFSNYSNGKPKHMSKIMVSNCWYFLFHEWKYVWEQSYVIIETKIWEDINKIDTKALICIVISRSKWKERIAITIWRSCFVDIFWY